MQKLDELRARWGAFRQERRGHENTWQDIYDHAWPFRGDITTQRSEGETRMVGLYDTTMMMAVNDLANFLKSSILPTSTSWLRLEPEREYRDNTRIRQAFHTTSERILEALMQSNFYVEAAASLRDLVCIGNQCLSVREDSPMMRADGSTFGGFVFKASSMKRIWWKFGWNPRPIMVVRELEMPAIDAARFFDNPGAQVTELVTNGKPMDKVKFLHFVYRNERGVRGGLRPGAERPFVSEYVATNGGDSAWETVGRGGFDENPYVCSRWMVVDGEEYGRGPGHIARPDARGVNELRRKVLEAADYDLDPPLIVEDENAIDVDVRAGGQVVVKPAMKMAPTYLNSGARYDVANQVGVEDREQIRKALLADALRGKDTQPRSAEESRLEAERQMRLLAAPADVIDSEFLNPLISVLVDKMLKADALPELAEVASQEGEVSMKPVFVSPFFSAQKSAQVARIQGFLARRIELFQATQDPDYLIDIDPQKVTQYDSIESDVTAAIFRTPEEVAALRQQRAQQQQLQMQREALQNVQTAGQAAQAVEGA